MGRKKPFYFFPPKMENCLRRISKSVSCLMSDSASSPSTKTSSPNTEVAGDPFVHLHLHSVYSLLDGAIRLNELVAKVKKMGMSAVAVTDHGNMFGAIDFYKEAKAQGIKPIIGMEAYVSPGSRFDKKNVERLKDGNNYHLILLAKNQTGYKNLMKLSSRAYLEGFYRKPRIDYELLAQHSEGLIVTSACIAGEVNRKLVNGEYEQAKELAIHLDKIMGRGNFYLELQKHGIEEQAIAARGAIQIHEETGIPLVVANDAHFLNKEDQKAQEMMLRIQLQKTLDDPLEFAFNDEFYVKSGNQMRALFPDYPSAAENTKVIADMVDLELEFGKPLLPQFITPNGETLQEYLDALSWQGLEKFFAKQNTTTENQITIPPAYQERLNYELGVIHSMGFDGYFLIVADFIRFARSQNIPVGPGRGSAAGSLVAFCLGITNVDPLKYDLLFERFLNPSRNEMPDIDIDFCRDRREEVIQYVIDKYGEDHVSQIITFGTLSARAVIKDVARVMGFDFAEMNALSKHMPDTPGISLDDAIAASKEAQEFFKSGEKEKELLEISRKLEGNPRNAGKHAAGVVIAPEPLENFVPLSRDSKTGAVVSQYDKSPLEQVGLVKMDFLGLKNLTTIQLVLDEIAAQQNIRLDINDIPLDDPLPYEYLQKGLTKGIFQVEQSGMTKLLMRAKPEKFEDIVACIALYRPGPLESGMTESYINRKNGLEKVSYPHPSLQEVLQNTYGTVVYQEQVMLISQQIGGFTMAEADVLRKAMGKKKKDVMDKLRAKFIDGAKERNISANLAANIYDDIAKFAAYGFNKSHSVAYGLITYQTAYLKSHFPIEFMKASLDIDIENTDKLIGVIRMARDMGIAILPPDINESNEFFTIVDKNKIRYGLLGIKGMGSNVVKDFVEARNKQKGNKFSDITNFLSSVDARSINKKSIEALIFSGAFDNFGHTRAALFESRFSMLSFANQKKIDKESGQTALFGEMEDSVPEFQIVSVDEWEERIKILQEKEALGLFLTMHPLDNYESMVKESKITHIGDIDDGISSERKINLAGVIEKITAKSVKGNNSYIVTLSDQTGITDVRIFGNLYQQVKEHVQENKIVIVNCRVTIHREQDVPSVFVSANKVEGVEALENLISKSLHIMLDFSDKNVYQEKLKTLKNILVSHRGGNPVYLHYRDEGAVKAAKVHSSFFVDYNANLDKKLQEFLENQKHFAWRIGSQIRMM